MYGSKREQLVDGLVRLAVVPFLVVAPVGPAAGGSVFLLMVVVFLAMVLVTGGFAAVVLALFGEDGLVLDVHRAARLAEVKNDRARGESGRYRMTSPSAALRDRGATARLIGVRRK